MLNTRLHQANIESTLVIQRNTMEYEKPITGEFTATAQLESTKDWPKFLRHFSRMGKARTTLISTLHYQQQRAGFFRGEFVALQK
ncbi:thioesterase domain-containing protein, putative [Methylophaga sulfidovorans]|uniref:Thioesterase domain-containing protein, putative n=1 Tax=Methylophaga sulfidovorans TaxID=45496 RepID=A0A1I3ZI39_9GAMM|nr:thioesterase domain-containing protein, putative [Methylophaga sulfidovorans]